ncbi:MAG: hypothetical protein PHC62_00140 [Candidatus Izemoplasmatales bacterium]|nr:hypothetical protein [Candidatus Izemoplasmatales bacterium]
MKKENRITAMRFIKESFQSGMEVDSLLMVSDMKLEDIIDITDLNGMNVNIVEDTSTLRRKGLCLIAVFRNEHGEYYIVIDEYFKRLPKYVQQFFMYHEIAHIIYGDLEDKKTAIKERRKRTLTGKSNNELRADEYAASMIGFDKAIKSLWVMAKLSSPLVINHKEINRRIKALKNY